MPINQKPGWVIYLTGLPSSGKSTLAYTLRGLLAEREISTQVLDSDGVRQVLTPEPTYSPAERDWFYQALAYIACLLATNGVNVLVAATAPLQAHRQVARSRIDRFLEVYVSCPPEICRQRDPKGLWARSDAGELDTLPGAGYPYQPPNSPEWTVDTWHFSAHQAAEMLLHFLVNHKYFSDSYLG